VCATHKSSHPIANHPFYDYAGSFAHPPYSFLPFCLIMIKLTSQCQAASETGKPRPEKRENNWSFESNFVHKKKGITAYAIQYFLEERGEERQMLECINYF